MMLLVQGGKEFKIINIWSETDYRTYHEVLICKFQIKLKWKKKAHKCPLYDLEFIPTILNKNTRNCFEFLFSWQPWLCLFSWLSEIFSRAFFNTSGQKCQYSFLFKVQLLLPYNPSGKIMFIPNTGASFPRPSLLLYQVIVCSIFFCLWIPLFDP